MNRTAKRTLHAVSLPVLAVMAVLAPLRQGSAQDVAEKPQASVATVLVDALRATEARVHSVRLELETSGRMQGGLSFSTRGSLRVLRTEQGRAAAMHSVVEFDFADGLGGSMETLTTDDGVVVLQQDPTFGEVCVRIDKAIVGDLEWAGMVLEKTDLPFQGDPRGSAPLGSAMLSDLALRFDLQPIERPADPARNGRWFGGDRLKAAKIEEAGNELPISDRVEVFVREADNALLEVVHLRAGEIVQRIHVKLLVLDEPMPLDSFRMRDPSKKPRDVKDHPPMWQQIEQVLERAMARAGGELRPSKR